MGEQEPASGTVLPCAEPIGWEYLPKRYHSSGCKHRCKCMYSTEQPIIRISWQFDRSQKTEKEPNMKIKLWWSVKRSNLSLGNSKRWILCTVLRMAYASFYNVDHSISGPVSLPDKKNGWRRCSVYGFAMSFRGTCVTIPDHPEFDASAKTQSWRETSLWKSATLCFRALLHSWKASPSASSHWMYLKQTLATAEVLLFPACRYIFPNCQKWPNCYRKTRNSIPHAVHCTHKLLNLSSSNRWLHLTKDFHSLGVQTDAFCREHIDKPK